MRSSRVVWTLQAKSDLREIKSFIARDAPWTAMAFIRRVRSAVNRIRAFPDRGRVVPEIGRPELREIFQGSYRIIYRTRDDRIEILTVFHGARLLTPEDLDT